MIDVCLNSGKTRRSYSSKDTDYDGSSLFEGLISMAPQFHVLRLLRSLDSSTLLVVKLAKVQSAGSILREFLEFAVDLKSGRSLFRLAIQTDSTQTSAD